MALRRLLAVRSSGDANHTYGNVPDLILFVSVSLFCGRAFLLVCLYTPAAFLTVNCCFRLFAATL